MRPWRLLCAVPGERQGHWGATCWYLSWYLLVLLSLTLWVGPLDAPSGSGKDVSLSIVSLPFSMGHWCS